MNFLKRLGARLSSGASSEADARPRTKRILIDYDSTLNPGQGNQPLTPERSKLLQPFLAGWRALGLEIYVLTSSNPVKKEEALRAAGLLDLFAAVLSSSFPKKFGTKGEYLSKRISEDGWKPNEQILVDDSLEAIQSIWQSSDGQVLSSPLAHTFRLPQHSKDGLVEADLQQLDSIIKNSAKTNETDLFVHVYSFMFNGERSVDLGDSLQKSTLDTLPEEQKAVVLNANTPEMRKAWTYGRRDFAAMCDGSKPVVEESQENAKVPTPKEKREPWQATAGKGAGKGKELGKGILSPAAEFVRARSVSPAPDMTRMKSTNFGHDNVPRPLAPLSGALSPEPRAGARRQTHREKYGCAPEKRDDDQGTEDEGMARAKERADEVLQTSKQGVPSDAPGALSEPKGKGKTNEEALAKAQEAAGKAKGKGKTDPPAGKGKAKGDAQEPSMDTPAAAAEGKGKGKTSPPAGKGKAKGDAQEPSVETSAAPGGGKGKGKTDLPAGKGKAKGDAKEPSADIPAAAAEGKGKGKTEPPTGKGKAKGDAQEPSTEIPAAAAEGKGKGKTDPAAGKGKAKGDAQEPSPGTPAAAVEGKGKGKTDPPAGKGKAKGDAQELSAVIPAAVAEGNGKGKTGGKGKAKEDAQEPSTDIPAAVAEGKGKGKIDPPAGKGKAKGDVQEPSAGTPAAAVEGKGKGKIDPPAGKGKATGDAQELPTNIPAAAAEGHGKGTTDPPAGKGKAKEDAQEPSVDTPGAAAEGKGKGKTDPPVGKGKAKGDAQGPSAVTSAAAAADGKGKGNSNLPAVKGKAKGDAQEPSVDTPAAAADGKGKGETDPPAGKGKAQGDAQEASAGAPAAAAEGKGTGETDSTVVKGEAKGDAQEPSADTSAVAAVAKGKGKTDPPAGKGKAKGDAQEPSADTPAAAAKQNGTAKTDPSAGKGKAKGDAPEPSADTSAAAAKENGKGKTDPSAGKGKAKGDAPGPPGAMLRRQSSTVVSAAGPDQDSGGRSLELAHAGPTPKAGALMRGQGLSNSEEPSIDGLSSKMVKIQSTRSVRFNSAVSERSLKETGLDQSMSMTSACSYQTQSSEIWDNGGISGRNQFFLENGLVLPPGGFPDPPPDNKRMTMKRSTVVAPKGAPSASSDATTAPSASSNATIESVCLSVGPFSQSTQTAFRFEPPEGKSKFSTAAKFIRKSIAVGSLPAGDSNGETLRQEDLHKELASVEEKAKKAEREKLEGELDLAQTELDLARQAVKATEEDEMASMKSRKTERRTAVQVRRITLSSTDITEMAVPGESAAHDTARGAAATPSSSSSARMTQRRTVTLPGGLAVDVEDELKQISDQIEQVAQRKTVRKTQLLQSLDVEDDDLAPEIRTRTCTVSGFTELRSDSGQAVSQPTRQVDLSPTAVTAASVDTSDLSEALSRMEVATDVVSNCLEKRHDAKPSEPRIYNSDSWEIHAALDRIERLAVMMEHG